MKHLLVVEVHERDVDVSCFLVLDGDPSFFFNDTATTEIYTLSLHDALPIQIAHAVRAGTLPPIHRDLWDRLLIAQAQRSEEHTSELQSLAYLVCRLLLEKKKKKSCVGFLFSQPNTKLFFFL